jgi:hypothetical protein
MDHIIIPLRKQHMWDILPTLIKYVDSYKTLALLLISFLLITSYLFTMYNQMSIPVAQAHLEHLPHYNSGGDRHGYGKYLSFMALDPEYGTIDHPSRITFSIQDFDNNDVYNVSTMVEIYELISGKRIHVFPWTFRDVGDFNLYYQFPKKANYQIVLSIKNANNNTGSELPSYLYSSRVDPPRSILGELSGCDCTRTIFNISISSGFGDIRNLLYFISIASPITLLGYVLTKNYMKKRNELNRTKKMRAEYRRANNIRTDRFSVSNESNNEVNMISTNTKQNVKYCITLLALAGGLVHLVVYPEHGSIHVYYTIFLLSAAGAQVTYGILYFLIMLSKPFYEMSDEQQQVRKSTYKKTMAVNLFGFIGTAVLVGLYTYSVIYPPPLSPVNKPEQIEFVGIFAKSLEIALLVGIIFIMKWDKDAYRRMMMKIKP